MTLYRQMALLLSLLLFIIFITVLVMVFNSTKESTKDALYEDAQNSASTLSLSLATNADDMSAMQTMINASFDNGNYQKISLIGVEGDKIFERKNEQRVSDLPRWFIKFVEFKAPVATAQVSQGWSVIGDLEIQSDIYTTYQKLYDTFISLIISMSIVLLVSLFILNILLHFVLKSLKNIETLAKNISQGKFETIENLPSTLELKNVSLSMNDMSDKIKNMISKLNNNLEKMTKELSKDDLTGLEKEQTFNTDMKMMFIKKQDGYVSSVKINNFIDFAKNNNKKLVDKFLKDFANILAKSSENTTAYRFYGSVFATITKVSDHDEIINITKNLQISLKNLGAEYGLSDIVNIGVTPFNPVSTTEDILEFANVAYDKAKEIGANEFYIRDKNDLAADMLEWKNLICNIIDNSTFDVNYKFQALSMDEKRTKLLEEASTYITDENKKAIQIGTFISVAEMYNKVVDFDKAVVNKVIDYIKNKNIKNGVIINIAPDSLVDDGFKEFVKGTLNLNKEVASQLIFAMTAYGCVKNIDAFKNFIDLLHKNGAKVILKRFETKFIPLDNLKGFNLDYIRLANEYTQGIESDKSKQSFIESICELSKLLNIKVIAEEVNSENEFNILHELGIYGSNIKKS